MSEPDPRLPADLPRHLPTKEFGTGHRLLRIHETGHRPIWYGPARASPPSNRFDDPEGVYRTLYAALDDAGAFAETFLRDRSRVRVLSIRETTKARISELRFVRTVRLVRLHGPGARRIGADGNVASGPYAVSRAWGRAIWAHADTVDGIIYRARHDDDLLAVALFARGDQVVKVVGSPVPLGRDLLLRMAVRYGFGLTR